MFDVKSLIYLLVMTGGDIPYFVWVSCNCFILFRWWHYFLGCL